LAQNEENNSLIGSQLLSDKYENDSVPSTVPEEYLKPFDKEENFIDDDDIELDYIGHYVNIPVPTQSDFFVHMGGLSDFQECSGYKKREVKLEILKNDAAAQRKHEEKLIEEERKKAQEKI
jgi:hypothetical protein